MCSSLDTAWKHSFLCSLSDDVISEPALLSRLQGGEAPCNEEEAAPREIPAEPGAGEGWMKALILGVRVVWCCHDRGCHHTEVMLLVCSEGTSWISKGDGSGRVTEGDKKCNRFDF